MWLRKKFKIKCLGMRTLRYWWCLTCKYHISSEERYKDNYKYISTKYWRKITRILPECFNMDGENCQKSKNRQKHESIDAKYNEINHRFDFSWVYVFSLFSQALKRKINIFSLKYWKNTYTFRVYTLILSLWQKIHYFKNEEKSCFWFSCSDNHW